MRTRSGPLTLAIFLSGTFALVALFLSPRDLFLEATILATLVMVAAAYSAGGLRELGRPRVKAIVFGLASAGALYGLFYLGARAIGFLHPLGLTANAENGIYGLINNPSTPVALRVTALVFDAAGFEAFFRGSLQKMTAPRLGFAAIPAVALLDSLLHLATLFQYPSIALLWVATTFIADTVWGLTYRFSGSLWGSFVSHLVWDLSIFLVAPIT